MKKSIYESGRLMEQIGKRAVRKAREENKRLGLPNVFSIDDTTYYELPDGTITKDRPEILDGKEH